MSKKNTPVADSTLGLTEQQIRTSVDQSIVAIASIFVDDIVTEDEVDGNVQSITKNRLWYLQSRMVNGFVWKLESEMLDARKKMLEHEAILQSYERAESGIVTQRMRDDKEFWFEQHREAYYLAAIAFDQALPMHELVLGQPFKTAAERAAASKAGKKAVETRRVVADVAAIEKRLGLG